MKVLQIHNEYRYSGGEDAVVRNEHKLLNDIGVQTCQLLFTNQNIHYRKVFFNRQSYKKTLQQIERFEPDIVHVHNIFYNATPSVLKAAKDMGLPVVMTLHNFRLICPSALLLRDKRLCTKCVNLKMPVYGTIHKCFQNSFSKSLLLSTFLGYSKAISIWNQYVDQFVVLTPFIKSIFEGSSLGVSNNKILVKPNSTEDLLIDGKYIPSHDRLGYLFVGRLSEEKGIDILVDAFNEMPEKELCIIGTGPMESFLRDKAKGNIKFLGTQPKEVVAKHLRNTKALVFPSICLEGLPNTIIEAFSAASPVIASNNDNLAQIILEGYNGMLFNAGDIQSLKETIMEFETQSAFKLYENARSTYLNYYTHEINSNSMLRIYKSLLQSS